MQDCKLARDFQAIMDAKREKKEPLLENYNMVFANKSPIYNDRMRNRQLSEYRVKVFKEVICECVGNLYVSSLVLDDPYQYYDSLKESAHDYVDDILTECNTVHDIKNKLNANPNFYLSDIMTLAEDISNAKCDELRKSEDEIPDTVRLDSDDRELIKNFEETEGKDNFAEDLQQRVVDIYRAEQKLAEDHKQVVQNAVDTISGFNNDKLTESVIEHGFSCVKNRPETLFSSIFMNKSKKVINESGTATVELGEDVLAETIATYTLLECCNAIGLTNMDITEKKDLERKFLNH